MTRLYGRAFSYECVDDYVPDVRFERMSVVGVLGLDGFVVPLSFKGSLNGWLFGEYVKYCLVPLMKKGDTLILDNSFGSQS
ncbi:MAG: hypothetical protein LBE76_02875 [Nitrososphaerota archaeon]|jgi:hypothetical protein|nr:hypothetical protein [Nitrososphaerota archaeon]